jgi:hypothetical protein
MTEEGVYIGLTELSSEFTITFSHTFMVLGVFEDDDMPLLEIEPIEGFQVLDLDGNVVREYQFNETMRETWHRSEIVSRTIDPSGIVFTACDDDWGLSNRNCSIYQYTFEDNSLLELYSLENTSSVFFDSSPDGELIAVSSCDLNGSNNYLGVYAFGDDVPLYEYTEQCVEYPALSPDGKHLIYQWRRIENQYLVESGIRMINLESMEVVDLVSDFFYVEFMDWSP